MNGNGAVEFFVFVDAWLRCRLVVGKCQAAPWASRCDLLTTSSPRQARSGHISRYSGRTSLCTRRSPTMTAWPTAAVLLMVSVVGAGGSIGTRCVWCACVGVAMWFAYMRGRHPRTELGRCGDVCVYNGSAVRDATCTTASVPRFALGPRTKDLLCVLRPARTKDLLCVSYGTPGRRTCPVSLVRHARTKDLLGLA